MSDAGVFIIVGGAGGIGTCVCRRLASRGERVIAAGRDAERLARVASETGVATQQVDAAAPDELNTMVENVLSREGRLDGAANLAGAFLLKPAHLTSDAEFAEQVSRNLLTSFHVVRAAARAMMPSGGSIVLVSSVAARLGLANHEAVAATKAGVEGLMRSAAATYAPKGVRVNAVAPGLTRTPMTERLTTNEATLKASIAMHPLARIGEPDEVARVIEWLLTPESGFVTGQTIGVDGGMSTVRSAARG